MALRNLCPVSRATTVAQRRHYWSSCPTIIRTVHLRCYCPHICWCRFLQPNETAYTRIEARSHRVFRPRPIVYPNLIRLSKRNEHCRSSGNHHCIWWEFARCDWRYPWDRGRWIEISAMWSVVLDERWDRWEQGICHPLLRTCFIWWLFVRFKSLGPIPCQSTGLWKPAYYTELCTHFAIDSVLEVSKSYYSQPIIIIIHNHDKKSSISRVLRSATWVYFTSLFHTVSVLQK